MAITGDQRLLKRINRMALVRLVRGRPGLSRAELAAETGLTKSTVSLLVQELIDEGWLREDEVLVTGAIGRRPTPLRLDDRRLALIGAELGVGFLAVVATNLSGEVVAKASQTVASERDATETLQLLCQMVDNVVRDVRDAGRVVLGVGIGAPGAVQESSGILAVAPNLGWRDIPIRDWMLKSFQADALGDIPVFVQNDADVAALGEVEFCSIGVGDPLLFLSLGVGVGAGVVVGGRLLLGRRGFAGEVGHIQLQSDGPTCSCGRRGCAEAFFGLQVMLNALQSAKLELLDASRSEAFVENLLSTAGERLGVLMHNLWTTLDPGLIVLGGPSCKLGPRFIDAARETFQRLANEAGLEVPSVVQARYGELMIPVGAAALVLHKYLQPI